eukprot:Hpha_TRINITY_DN29982_c0_g1::TRINITY_DN29982_c0_g1_i1::g.131930::m.131930
MYRSPAVPPPESPGLLADMQGVLSSLDSYATAQASTVPARTAGKRRYASAAEVVSQYRTPPSAPSSLFRHPPRKAERVKPTPYSYSVMVEDDYDRDATGLMLAAPPPGAHSGWRRIKAKTDPRRDRAPHKGTPSHIEPMGEVWHRVGPGDGQWPPAEDLGPLPDDELREVGTYDPEDIFYDFALDFPGHPHYQKNGGEPLRGKAPGGRLMMQQVAAEIMQRRENGTFPRERERWEETGAALGPKKTTSAPEQSARMREMIEQVTLTPTELGPNGSGTKDFVLQASFLPGNVGVSLVMPGADDYDYYYPEEAEEYEEEEDYEYEGTDEFQENLNRYGLPAPAETDDEYEEQMRVFRERMREYRKANPDKYPDYLRQVLNSGLPERYRRHYQKQLDKIEANGGKVPTKKDKKDKKRLKGSSAGGGSGASAASPDPEAVRDAIGEIDAPPPAALTTKLSAQELKSEGTGTEKTSSSKKRH